MERTYKLVWLVLVLSAALVLVVANVYKLVKDKELLDSNYELLLTFVQSSQILMAPIGIFSFWLLSCNQVYHREWEKRPLLSMFILCSIWLCVTLLVTPIGLTFIKNKIESREGRTAMSVLTLISLYFTTKFESQMLLARYTHQKMKDPLFFEKSCKP